MSESPDIRPAKGTMRDQLRHGLAWFHGRVMKEVEREDSDRPKIVDTVRPSAVDRNL